MRRRAVIASGALLIGTSTAGCVDELLGAQSTTLDERASLPVRESEVSEDQFQTHTGTIEERYDTAGIWGKAKRAPDHELEFVGAWLEEFPSEEFVVEGTATIFRLPDAASDERNAYQVLLWAGIDTFAAGIRPRTLQTGIDVTSDRATTGTYAPGSTITGPYTVDIGRLGTKTIATEMPLPAGELSPAAEQTKIGDAGAYALAWRGGHDGHIAIAGTCELGFDPAEDPDLFWTISAEVERTEQ